MFICYCVTWKLNNRVKQCGPISLSNFFVPSLLSQMSLPALPHAYISFPLFSSHLLQHSMSAALQRSTDNEVLGSSKYWYVQYMYVLVTCSSVAQVLELYSNQPWSSNVNALRYTHVHSYFVYVFLQWSCLKWLRQRRHSTWLWSMLVEVWTSAQVLHHHEQQHTHICHCTYIHTRWHTSNCYWVWDTNLFSHCANQCVCVHCLYT